MVDMNFARTEKCNVRNLVESNGLGKRCLNFSAANNTTRQLLAQNDPAYKLVDVVAYSARGWRGHERIAVDIEKGRVERSFERVIHIVESYSILDHVAGVI